MPTDSEENTYPLEGRDSKSLSRVEIIGAIPFAPTLRSAPGTCAVYRITSSTILKCGRHIQLSEARTMEYISLHTSIPVPAVIDAWEVEDSRYEDDPNTCYILMQYIPGTVLEDLWDGYDNESQRRVQGEIFKYVQQLQNLQFSTPGPIGGGRSVANLFTGYDAGPFKSADELAEWYNGRLTVCHMFHHAPHIPAGAFTGTFKELVMCHLDLHPRNIILDDAGKLWLIDWGQAGAYPPWFEKAIMSWGTGSGSWPLGFLELFGKESWKSEVELLLSVGFALTTAGYCQPQKLPQETSAAAEESHVSLPAHN